MFLCVDHPKLCKEVWVVRFWQVSRACYSGCQMFKNMLSLQFFADFDPKYLCFHKAKPGNSYLLSAILFWLLLFEWRFLFHGPTRAMSKNYVESNKLMITFFCKLDLSKFMCNGHHQTVHPPPLTPTHPHPLPPTQNNLQYTSTHPK